MVASRNRSISVRAYNFMRSGRDALRPFFSKRQSDTREMPPSISQACSVVYASRSMMRPPVAVGCVNVSTHTYLCLIVASVKRINSGNSKGSAAIKSGHDPLGLPAFHPSNSRRLVLSMARSAVRLSHWVCSMMLSMMAARFGAGKDSLLRWLPLV